ncbi:hypothetical protein BC374_12780 [Ensifer sp. LC13]|nr:hypothetical protein BC362_02740 [Ensifer sp. LC14]OCP13706.1 hypothetical protein BC374_12780 [Ensifer sp. LC13]OCP29069.1 hypothetical protein BC364_11180 [Ensifer sp. LC499]
MRSHERARDVLDTRILISLAKLPVFRLQHPQVNGEDTRDNLYGAANWFDDGEAAVVELAVAEDRGPTAQ